MDRLRLNALEFSCRCYEQSALSSAHCIVAWAIRNRPQSPTVTWSAVTHCSLRKRDIPLREGHTLGIDRIRNPNHDFVSGRLGNMCGFRPE